MNKLKLKFNPYTYVRTYVMYSMLLKKHDYDKLQKMGFDEIAEFLQNTDYRQEIDQYALEYKGADLLEHAINANLKRNFEKLKRISDDEMMALISAYMLRYDFWNLKTMARAKVSGHKDVDSVIMPLGNLGKDQLLKLFEMPLQDMFKKSGLFDNTVEFIASVASLSLSEIENRLDKRYFAMMLEFSEKLPKQGEHFRNFIQLEVNIQNITTMMKFRKLSLENSKLSGFIIPFGEKINSKIKKIISQKDDEHMIHSLKAEFPEIKHILDNNYDLTTLESQLRKHAMKKSIALLHRNIQSIDVILAYMFTKEIEAKNLKLLLKGRQLNVKQDIIERELVA